MATVAQQLLRRKPTTPVGADEVHLKRSLGVVQLTLIGVGATIGTGIFFVMSEAVPKAGPAVIWSFVIAGTVAALTALCYAELASAVPVSGSSYSYAYATLGEGTAMAVAACLLLEWGVSTAAVAVGWSQYVNELLRNVFGFEIPNALANAPEEGGVVNLPAIILIVMCALLLIRGTRESITVNAVMVCIKIAVLIFFVGVGVTGWNVDHFANFSPYGLTGVMGAAGTIFFSFIGVDAVATAGEEAKNPRRNLPVAIISSLVIVTVLYIAVAAVAVGAQSVDQFEGQEAGLSAILEHIIGATWPGTVVAMGAVISIFSVTLVGLYAQTRILFTMSRDGMIPPVFARLSPRTMTPVHGTVIVAVVVSIPAGVVPINFLAEMTSIGTLAAFLVVSLGVIILRRREPDLDRGFKVPGYPVLPVLSIIGCLWIITQLDPITIIAFVVWTAVVMIFYCFYGRKHSELEVGHPVVAPDPDIPSATRAGQSDLEDDRNAAKHGKDA